MRWEIPGPWPSMQEIERRFDELIRSQWGMSPHQPGVDAVVGEGELWIRIDLPGVDESDFDVHRSGDILVVEGVRRSPPSEEPALHRMRVERWSGSFRCAIQIPDEFARSQIEATLASGVLEIHLVRSSGSGGSE